MICKQYLNSTVLHHFFVDFDFRKIVIGHAAVDTNPTGSKEANITEGEAIAYLIAPPLEAMLGLDAALKAADVKMGVFYGPPSETNFGGALLSGTQSACKAACNAVAQTVQKVATDPKDY